MLRINLQQIRRGCGCGGGHGADVAVLAAGTIIFWTVVLVPGLILWAVPLAITTAGLVAVGTVVVLAIDWFWTRLMAACP